MVRAQGTLRPPYTCPSHDLIAVWQGQGASTDQGGGGGGGVEEEETWCAGTGNSLALSATETFELKVLNIDDCVF